MMHAVGTIDALFEELKTTSFQQPENFDADKEGAGWVISSGANDWEIGVTGMTVTFAPVKWGGYRPSAKRIWVHVNNESVGGNDADRPNGDEAEVNQWGEKARTTWVRIATQIKREKTKERVPKDWWRAFVEALSDPEMKPFVKEWGTDETEWINKGRPEWGEASPIGERYDPPALPDEREPDDDFSEFETHELACDFIEQEVGRLDYKRNWGKLKERHKREGLAQKVKRWLNHYEIEHDPQGLVDYIDRMVNRYPGRWM